MEKLLEENLCGEIKVHVVRNLKASLNRKLESESVVTYRLLEIQESHLK